LLTKKFWFQLGVGILLTLIIITFLVEVQWIFSPILVIVQTIFIPLLVSGVLFYLSQPLQALLEKYKTPRWGSIIIIVALILGIIWVAFSIVGPPISEEFNNLVHKAPALAEDANDLVVGVINETDNLPQWAIDSLDEQTESIMNYLKDASSQAGKWVFSIFQSIVQGALILILIPFFLIFMLKDHEKFLPFITQFFSGTMKEWVQKTFSEMNQVLSLYIRGQVLVSTILAILLYIGYMIIDLNFALLLVIFAFFMNIIPFIGPWIAFVPALIIGAVQDPMLIIWVSLITLIAQQTDSNFITPNVMGKTLNIHPLTIITILLAAGSLAGFFGILLAVPGYAVGKAIISNIYEYRKEIKETANKQV